MQNKLILVLLTVIACCFVACDQTTECKYHRDTYDISTAKPNNNWVFDKASREFVSHVNMSVITPFIYNYGNSAANSTKVTMMLIRYNCQ